MKRQVHRIVLLVVDHDRLGAQSVADVLVEQRYPNRCIAPRMLETSTREVEWDDDHPLNSGRTFVAAATKLFSVSEPSGVPSYSLISCDLCGTGLLGKDPRPGWYSDSEEIKCTDCGAVNHVSCDGESDPYVSGYVCRHGKDSDTLCDLCEIEDGAGTGEVAT